MKDVSEIRERTAEIDGVNDIHRIRILSIDAQRNYATMHIVCEGKPHDIKARIREARRAKYRAGSPRIRGAERDAPQGALPRGAQKPRASPTSPLSMQINRF